MKIVRINFCSALCCTLLTASIGTTPRAVMAETTLERQISTAAMPHLTQNSSQHVQAHMVSLIGQLDGDPGNGKRLGELKAAAAQCVDFHQKNNLPVKLQNEWPDHLNGIREVSYFAKNFSITYLSTWNYGINVSDCSLIEGHGESAALKSSAGLCSIDLLKKSSKGRCSWDAHRKAVAIPAGQPGMSTGKPAGMPAGAFAHIQAMMPSAAGPGKTILKIACQPEVLMGDTFCVARGGSFIPAQKMILERISAKGISMKANAAALDIGVAEDVFTPHLAASFSTSNGGNAK